MDVTWNSNPNIHLVVSKKPKMEIEIQLEPDWTVLWLIKAFWVSEHFRQILPFSRQHLKSSAAEGVNKSEIQLSMHFAALIDDDSLWLDEQEIPGINLYLWFNFDEEIRKNKQGCQVGKGSIGLDFAPTFAVITTSREKAGSTVSSKLKTETCGRPDFVPG